MPEMLPCILCQTMPHKDNFGIIHDTLGFKSYGNYGSTVYDPIGGHEFLTINICDDCIRKAADKGLVKEATVIPKPDKVTYKRWHYDVEDE